MKDTPAIYNGRIVSKKNFRAFIHAPNGSKKLVDSWDEYEKHMETGLWFPDAESAQCAAIVPKEPEPEPVVLEKPKASKTKKVDDGFLPKTR